MRRVIAALLAVILLFTAGFAVYYIKTGSGVGKTVTAVETTYEKSAETEGFILKNEKIINISGGEFARFYYKNGEKVSGNSKIVSLYNSESDGALLSEIEKLDERIKSLGSEYVNLTANDVIKVENYIDSDIDKLGDAMAKGDAAEETLIRDRLTALFNIKHTNSAPANDDEEALMREKQALEGKLSSAKNDIFAPMGGIFAEKTDGFEDALSLDEAMQITVSGVDELLSAKGKETEKAVKIIDNYKWYIVSKVPTKVVSDKEPGDRVRIKMPDGSEISGTIEYIAPDGEYSAIVISSDREFASLAESRKINIKLIFDRYTGFVIPTKAFHMYNGEYGVFVKSNSKKLFKKANTIYSDDEYSVVAKSSDTQIKLYDTIITDGDLSEYYDK